MAEILFGDEAKKFCAGLLNEESENHYRNRKDGNQKRGYFPDVTSKGTTVYVAFDNRTNDCWVEDFDTPELAVSWLNDEFEVDEITRK